MLSRRGLIRGLIAAPAIVAAAHIMPVRAIAGIAHLEGVHVTVISPSFLELINMDIRRSLAWGLQDQFRRAGLVTGHVGLWRGVTFLETLPRDHTGKE